MGMKAKTTAAVKQENAIIRYLKETRSELRNVVWPTRRQLLNLTAIVIAMILGMSAILGFIDYVFKVLFGLIIR
jgi:preprotein translocase subunit SecE